MLSCWRGLKRFYDRHGDTIRRIERVFAWFFPLVVLALITYAYVSFVVVFCFWFVLPGGHTGLFALYMTFAHVFFLGTIISFFQAVLRNPGWLEKEWSDAMDRKHQEQSSTLKAQSEQPDVVDAALSPTTSSVRQRNGGGEIEKGRGEEEEEGTTVALSRCRKCSLLRPPRAHHCSACGHCVLKFDHHCPVINNCVGLRNQKVFLLMTFYAILMLAVGMAFMFYHFFFVQSIACKWSGRLLLHLRLLNIVEMLNGNTFDVCRSPLDMWLLASMIIGVVVVVVFSLFLWFSCLPVVQNLTTLERAIWPGCRQFRGSFSQNFRQVFGARWWEWPLPWYFSNPLADGVIWLESDCECERCQRYKD